MLFSERRLLIILNMSILEVYNITWCGVQMEGLIIRQVVLSVWLDLLLQELGSWRRSFQQHLLR